MQRWGNRAELEHLGDGAADFFAVLGRLGTRLCGYPARQVLLLRERYGSDDIAAAQRRALSFGATDHRSVARILEARAAPRALAEYVTDEATRRAECALGRAETTGRDLDEYDRLPTLGGRAAEDPSWQETETAPS